MCGFKCFYDERLSYSMKFIYKTSEFWRQNLKYIFEIEKHEQVAFRKRTFVNNFRHNKLNFAD